MCVIDTIGQLPFAMVAILDAVGRIETEGRVYHLGYAVFTCPAEDEELEEFAEIEALSLNPQTIRLLLERLANPLTPLVWRRKFVEMNSIFHNDCLRSTTCRKSWPTSTRTSTKEIYSS